MYKFFETKSSLRELLLKFELLIKLMKTEVLCTTHQKNVLNHKNVHRYITGRITQEPNTKIVEKEISIKAKLDFF